MRAGVRELGVVPGAELCVCGVCVCVVNELGSYASDRVKCLQKSIPARARISHAQKTPCEDSQGVGSMSDAHTDSLLAQVAALGVEETAQHQLDALLQFGMKENSACRSTPVSRRAP